MLDFMALQKDKNRRLVIVPEDIRNIVNHLAIDAGLTFEQMAGKILADGANELFARFIAAKSTVAKQPPPKPTKPKNKG